MQRYFSTQKINNTFSLSSDDLYHIKTVMRMKDKENIQVVYEEKPYLCEVRYIDNDIQINEIEELKQDKEIIPEITLLIPILKEQKMDYIFQKATELGVNKFIPVIMERSVVKVGEKENKKLDRWKKIVKEASEQSHRNTIPIIENIIKLKDIEIDGLKLICSTVEKENTIKKVFQKNTNYDKMSMLVGPEGGISEKEENLLKEKGFIPVTLGPRIMRVETVPLYLMSIINYEYME